MKYITIVAALVVLLTTSAVFGSPTTSTKAMPLVCPVTGEVIPSIKDAAGHSTYKGKTYYFCCSGCKPLFDADPAKYVKALAKLKPAPPM